MDFKFSKPMLFQTKVLIGGLIVYFVIILFCIYEDNKCLLNDSVSFLDHSTDIGCAQNISLQGTWTHESKSRSGKVFGFIGSLYKFQRHTTAIESTSVMVLNLMMPEFFDQPHRQLAVKLVADAKGRLQLNKYEFQVTEAKGLPYVGIIGFDFSSISDSLRNYTIQSNDFVFDSSTHSFDMILTHYISSENLEEWHINIKLAGLDLIIDYCVYSFAFVLLFGLSLYASIDLLYQLHQRADLCMQLSVWTIFCVLCQDFLLFVVNVIFGLMMTSSSLIFICLLPTIMMCLNCLILVKVWMTQERIGNQNESTLNHYCRLHVKLYTLELLYAIIMIRFFLNFNLVLLNSLLLVPQIFHNFRLIETPVVFDKKFCLFFASSKTLLLIYLRGVPQSIVAINWSVLYSLGAFAILAISTWVLWMQSQLGPMEILPRWLRPKCHEYFIIISDLQNFNSIAKTKLNSSETENFRVESNDSSISNCSANICSICQEDLDKTVVISKDEPTVLKNPYLAKVLGKVVIGHLMKTPCGHVFHPKCLIVWMDIKLVCPVCRSQLPRIQ